MTQSSAPARYGRCIAVAPDAGFIAGVEHSTWPEMIFIATARVAKNAIQTAAKLKAERGIDLDTINFEYIPPGTESPWRGENIDPTHTLIAWSAEVAE